jgi:hypothetical protein
LLLLALVVIAIGAFKGTFPWTVAGQQCLVSLPLVVLPLVFILDRYLISSIPILCLWLAFSMRTAGAWLGARTRVQWLGSLAWLALLAIFVLSYGSRIRSTNPGGLKTERAIARRIAVAAPGCPARAGRVMVVDPTIPFFDNQDWVTPPRADLHDTVRYAHKMHVTSIVVYKDDTFWPAQSALLSVGKPAPG